MSLPRIRDEWHVPARPGQRVAVHIEGEGNYYGSITGCDDHDHLIVKFDRLSVPQRIHPKQVTYLKGRP